jgi:hypothetical protein
MLAICVKSRLRRARRGANWIFKGSLRRSSTVLEHHSFHPSETEGLNSKRAKGLPAQPSPTDLTKSVTVCELPRDPNEGSLNA